MVVALSEQMAPLYKAVVDAGVVLQIDDPALEGIPEEMVRYHGGWCQSARGRRRETLRSISARASVVGDAVVLSGVVT